MAIIVNMPEMHLDVSLPGKETTGEETEGAQDADKSQAPWYVFLFHSCFFTLLTTKLAF